jgi:hypothetical protein
MSEPLIPPAFEVFGGVVTAVLIVLALVALVTIAKSPSISPGQRAAWVIGAVLVPGVVPALWLVLLAIERRRLRQVPNE